jgi:hypothetical protein
VPVGEDRGGAEVPAGEQRCQRGSRGASWERQRWSIGASGGAEVPAGRAEVPVGEGRDGLEVPVWPWIILPA